MYTSDTSLIYLLQELLKYFFSLYEVFEQKISYRNKFGSPFRYRVKSLTLRHCPMLPFFPFKIYHTKLGFYVRTYQSNYQFTRQLGHLHRVMIFSSFGLQNIKANRISKSLTCKCQYTKPPSDHTYITLND